MSDYTRLSVDIFQCDGKGKPKLQITREKYDKEKNDWVFAKLGRMTYEEFVAVAKAAVSGLSKIPGSILPTNPAKDKTVEYREWISASIGQFRYAQFMLEEAGRPRSPQIDEFIAKLEGAIR